MKPGELESHRASVKRVENFGFLYVLLLISYMVSDVTIFVYLTCIDRMKINIKSIILLAIFGLSFLMTLISFLSTCFSDPGFVRPQYAYYSDSNQQGGQRYCHRCNLYKPERAHHCSLCKKCVLNMDHHCPWVSNCIGFYNKKLFINLLLYTNITLFVALVGSGYEVYSILSDIFRKNFDLLTFKDYIIVAAFIFRLVLFCILAVFFKFHLNLIDRNLTTLENLDLRRGGAPTNYNIGVEANREQVCGKESIMWICPFFTKSSLPGGNGQAWPRPGAIPLESVNLVDHDRSSPYRRNYSPTRGGGHPQDLSQFPPPGSHVMGSSFYPW